MSVSIWHEMGQPGANDVEMVRQGARFGVEAVEARAGLSDADIMGLVIPRVSDSITPLTAERFIGIGLGVRAAKYGLDVAGVEDDGYRFTDAREIARLYEARGRGARLAHEHGRGIHAGAFIRHMVEAARGGSALHDAVDLIGQTLSVRTFMLGGEHA